jgi:hypothetical protein
VEKEIRSEREPIHELFRFLFSKNLIIAAILFGILFIWIGSVVLTFSTDLTGYRAAQTLSSLGFFITGVFLIGGGIVNDTMDRYVRVGMVVIGVYMITSVLALTSLLSSCVYHVEKKPSECNHSLRILKGITKFMKISLKPRKRWQHQRKVLERCIILLRTIWAFDGEITENDYEWLKQLSYLV